MFMKKVLITDVSGMLGATLLKWHSGRCGCDLWLDRHKSDWQPGNKCLESVTVPQRFESR